jgi:hypothetical protein
MTSAVLWLRVQDEVARYLYVASNGSVLAIAALLLVVLIAGAGVVVLTRVLSSALGPLLQRRRHEHDAPAPPNAGYRLRRSMPNARMSL